MTGMPRSNLVGISDEEIQTIAASLKGFPLFWTPTKGMYRGEIVHK
jgi:hypothetical protein